MRFTGRKRPRFLLDLAEELIWLKEKAGADIAERWYEELLLTIQFIEKNPLIGRARKDLLPAGIRSWRVHGFNRWLIFYGVSQKNEIVLYRVRSGTMNLVVMQIDS